MASNSNIALSSSSSSSSSESTEIIALMPNQATGHGGSPIPFEQPIFRCGECPAVFHTSRALGGHKGSHTRARNFQASLQVRIMELRRTWLQAQEANAGAVASAPDLVEGVEEEDEEEGEDEPVELLVPKSEYSCENSDDEST